MKIGVISQETILRKEMNRIVVTLNSPLNSPSRCVVFRFSLIKSSFERVRGSINLGVDRWV